MMSLEIEVIDLRRLETGRNLFVFGELKGPLLTLAGLDQLNPQLWRSRHPLSLSPSAEKVASEPL